MKIRMTVVALLLALAGPAAACEGGKHGKGGCPMHAKGEAAGKDAKGGCKRCAGHGAKTADAKAPGEKADKGAKTAKAETYACAMNDYAGAMTKDGKCPKCGMKLEAKK